MRTRSLWALLASFVGHALIVAFLLWGPRSELGTALEKALTSSKHEKGHRDSRLDALSTRVVSEGELKRLVETAQSSENLKSETSARYLGERTQRVTKETRAQGFGSALGGSPRAAPPAQGRASRAAQDKLGALWTLPLELDQEDLAPQGTVSGMARGSMDALDRDVALGAETLLNTDEYVYASFFNRVKREVAPRWEPSIQRFLRTASGLELGLYATRYVFFVDENGVLKDIQILESSGSRELDEIAAQALRQVSRFPNPPTPLRTSEGLYRIELGFRVQHSRRNFQAEYLPDPRFMKRGRF